MDYLNKTKEQLISELIDQKQEFDSFKLLYNKGVADRNQIEYTLNERLKELSCHDQIAEIMSNSAFSIDEVCEKIVQIIPPSWQFPEIAEASIQIYEKVFTTPNFVKTKNSLKQEIITNQQIIGQIEVCYPVDKIGSDEQAFLPEESSLLFSIAVKLGNYMENKEKGLALKLSEEKHKDLIENINDVIYTTNSQGNITFISPSITRLLGYRPEDVIDKNFSYFTGETTEHLKKRFEEIKNKSELQSEYQILSVTGEPHWIRFSSKAIIKEGQFVGVTGILTDITEKKQVELELQKSESLYRSILHASPDTIFISDLEGHVLFTSPMALKMFGYEDSGFPLNSPLFDFIDPKDHYKANEAISQMFQGIYTGATEYVGIKADGSTFDIEANGEFIRNAEGNPTSMVFVVRDVSDRKLAEEKLHKSEETYRSLVESINDILYDITIDGTIKYVSPASERLFNLKPESLIGQNFFSFVHPEDRSFLLDIFRNNRFSDHKELEYRCITETSETVWVQASARNVYEEDRLVGRTGILHDITERKLIDEKLRQSEEQYRKLVESVNDVIFDIDATGNIRFISQSVLKVLGYTVEEAIGQNIFSFLHPEDVPVIINAFKNLSTRDYSFMEYRYVRKDGSIRWVRSSTTPQIEDGEMIGATGTMTDVTERRIAEEKLRKNEEQYRNLVTSLNDAIYEINKEGIIQYISPVIEKIVGYTPEELIGKNTFSFMHPDDIPGVMAALSQLDHIDIPYMEYRYLTKSGEICWVRTSTSPIFVNGLLTGGRGTLTNITERKLAEEKVQETEQRFRLVFENVFDGISIFEETPDPKNRKLIECNEQYAAMAGRSREELLEVGHTYSISKALEIGATEARMKGISEQKAYHGSFTWIRPDGKDNTIEYIARPITWQGKTYSIGIDRDITEYKQKEDRLRKLSQAVEQSPVSIVITDLDGNIEYANLKASQTTGYTLEELKGKNPRVLKSGETPNDEYQYLWDSISHGNTWRGIFHNKRKNGELYWESSQITPITDENGNITSYLAIKEDITERKQIQEELAKSEVRFSEITKQSQNVIWETDSEAVYTYVSQAAEMAWGLKPSDLVGKKRFFDIHPEDGRKEFMEACLRQVQRGEQFRNLESLVQGDDGKINWVMTNGMPYLDSEGNVKGYRGSSLNINQQKSAFEELRQSEERYKSIFRNNHSVMIIVDPETGDIKDVNNSACDYYKWTYDEMCSKNISEINVQSRKEIKEEMQKAKVEMRTHFYFKHRLSNGEIRDVEVYSCPLKFGDSTLLYSIVHDITDRRFAEEALLQREQDLNFSQEIAGMGSWQINMATNTSKWSDNMYRIFDLDPDKEKASQDLFFELIHPDDRHLIGEYMEKILRDRKQVTFEMRINLKSGKTIWIQNSMIPGFEGDQLVTLNGTNVDITSKKLSEEALRTNEAALNQAQEISMMCSWELDLIEEKLTWSKNYYHLMGISVGSEMSTQFFLERVHPEDIHLVDEKLKEMNLFKNPVTYDLRLRMPENKYRWIQNNIVPEFEDGKLIRYKGVNIDVTEKKLAEENIRQQNERLNAIINAIPDLIFVSDREGTYLEYYNINSQDLLYSADQLIGSTVREVFGEETANLHIRQIDECLQTKKMVTYEYSAAINGTNHYFEARLAPLGNDKVLRFVRDFTQEKQKDAELKKLYLSIAQSPVITVITDLRANIEYVNPAFIDITGYSREEVIGQNVRILQSGKTDKAIYKQLWETIKAGKEWHGEWINKKKDGELYWEDVLITPVRNDSGKVTNYLAVKQDITQRKQSEQEIHDLNTNLEHKIEERTSQLAKTNENLLSEIEERKRFENALSESEKSYRTVVENVNEVIFQTDAEGLWVFLNRSWEKVTGFTVEESIGQLFVNYVHPDDRARNLELFVPLIQRKKEYCRHEIRYLTKDGGFRWVEVFARLGLNDNDEITGTYGTLQDITDRKMFAEALQAKTAELEHFFAVTPDLLCITDMAGKFIKVNNAWESSLGYSIDTLENKAFFEFIHPDDIEPSASALLVLNKQNPIINFTNRYKSKDGSYRFIEWHSVPVGDLIYSAARDITERKLAEDFENELLQLSPTLTGLSLNKINDAITQALSRIGQFLSADRSYIFEFDASESAMNNTHEWCNTGINPEIENLQDVPCEVLPRWMEALNRHENIVITSVKDLPESWQAEREILEPQGIQSLIVMPLLAENTLIGFVGLDSVVAIKEYTTSEINILKVWSSMLGSLINNQRSGKLLEQTRQNYETFFNTIDDFLFIFDEQGNIVDSNNTVKVRLGYSNDELTNKSVLMVRPPERRKEALCVMKEILEGKVQYCSIPLITRSGEQIPVETRIKRGYWNGSPVIFGVSKDISQIKISEQKFASAFHSNSAVMTITRFDNDQFVDVNNAFVNTLGYSWEDIKGKTLVTLGIVRENSEEGTIQDAINRGIAVREIEINAYSKSNQLFILLLSAEEIYVGSERCILSVAVNITERKIMENELRKAREEAEQANMAKSEFLSRMSHELRTPMNSILGFAQLLEMGELNARQSKGVNHIMKSGKHLLDLINEVLDISRIEAGRLSLSLEPVQLSGVIPEMIDIVKPQIIERQIRIELIDAESNRMFVKSDRQRLKQILLNLLNNAIKYNRESGSIWIKTELRPVNELGVVMLRISITDTGWGISEEDLPKLFRPFERIGAEKSATEGTGLGLSVVKKLIEAMAGKLGVESQPETGSTFWIELPYSESPLEHIEKSGISINELEPKLTDLCGTILYIEDNASNIELVEQILTNQRSQIKLISNMTGAPTVQMAIDYRPDLILLDLNLPDMHGSKVLNLLLAEERTRNIPVVVISADAMPQQLERLLKSGAKEYLTKPLDVQEFLTMIDKYIPHQM